MTAIAMDSWLDQEDDPVVTVEGRIDFRAQDAHWQGEYQSQPYFRNECSYDEDYAPAFCVGYIGHAQYGGSFDDAEKSLFANWVRIKGDSRLTADEALQAIRAAWDHAAPSAAQSTPRPGFATA
ncbi:hypothetical protein WG902_08795 [Ramlibacter sp. PS3R-8]|uniref:hypothetical protein n=1 Tax=Ramlibacter sp. PS3R-8 TaxID=3133437 RepID=UPI00309E0284